MTNDAAPTVAVVITSYDHAHYIADAIRSVKEQSVAASEIVVVDDGSNDDPAAVAREFAVDVVRRTMPAWRRRATAVWPRSRQIT